MARKFADEVVAPRARDLDENEEFPTDTVRQMGDLGFLGLPYPEKYGGAGMDYIALGIASEVRLGFGSPVAELARMIDETGASLVITGSHGHRLIGDLLHGATVSALRHLVRCPVLTVPGSAPRRG